MPRWNPLRWSLGASALVALVVAGCGAASNQQRASLHTTAENRLLSLLARAREDVSHQNGTAVHAVLGEFVSEVQTLRTSGQLTSATAGSLDREAQATAVEAARKLHPATSRQLARGITRATQTTTTAADPATATVPGTGTTPSSTPQTTPPAANAPPAAINTQAQDDQGYGRNGSPFPGDGHAYGHRFGDHGSGWWGS